MPDGSSLYAAYTRGTNEATDIVVTASADRGQTWSTPVLRPRVALAPGAAFLSPAYAEGLAISLCALALVMLGRRRWLLAGVVGAFATISLPCRFGRLPCIPARTLRL